MQTIEATVENREKLRKAYKKAKKNGVEQFELDGKQFLTKYAGYLIEYLDMKLPPRK